MRKPARVCIIAGVVWSAAVLMFAYVPAAAGQTGGQVTQARHNADVPSDIVVKETHISLLKFALNLRPVQEPYWAPVEHALRELARWQAGTSGYEDRTGGRSGAIVAMRIKRIAAMAAPLIRALDENQLRSLHALSRWAGLEQLLAAN